MVIERVANPEKELVIEDKGDNEQDFDRLLAMNEEWANHFNEETRPSGNRISEESDKRHDAMVNMADRPQSLQDYLSDQLAFLDSPPEDLELMRYLISYIDERGYLATPLEEIANLRYVRDITMDGNRTRPQAGNRGRGGLDALPIAVGE